MIEAPKISSNNMQTIAPKNNSINRAYLAYVYGNKNEIGADVYVPSEKTQYYNEDASIKEKKTKTKKFGILLASGLSALALAGAFIAGKSNKNFANILNSKNIKGVSDSIKNSSILKKISNFMANINPIKDDAFERVGDFFKKKNIPILKHMDGYCNGTKGFYRKILSKFQRGNYENALKVLEKEGVDISKLGFDDWFSKLDKSILENLKEKGHFTKGIFNKDIFSKMANSNIADDILLKDVNGFKKLASAISESDLGVETLSKEGKAALEALNKSRSTIASKLRDINAGSAATDFVTMSASALGLGAAVAASDTKEEKKSVAVNVGIPLLTTLASSTFLGNAFAISGAKSLLFGLAAGQIAEFTTKVITKHPDKEETKA